MVDLIPEGCISLRSAFKRLYKALWGEDAPITGARQEQILLRIDPGLAALCRARLWKVKDALLQELVDVFASEALEAFVRPPNAGENFAIPADSWDSAFFPERVFLSTEIVHEHGGYWDELVGRTPFVRRQQFDMWLAAELQRRADPRTAVSAANQALRDYLIGMAMDGILPSTEIENLASEWGLPPLASEPHPQQFDPLQRPRWTLCMAVSWIVWGTLDDVREAMDDYRSQCMSWAPCRRGVQVGAEWIEVEGEELVSLKPDSVTLLGISEALDTDPREMRKRMTIKSAREELWRRLADGVLSAVGLDINEQITAIPAYEWSYMQLAGRRKGADYLVYSNDITRKAYTDITIGRQMIGDNWYGFSESISVHSSDLTARKSVENVREHLELAIDVGSQTVRFANGPCLRGNAFKLITRLSEQHELDLIARKASLNYGFVQSDKLERDLQVSDDVLRKWVERARRDIEKQFRTHWGFIPDIHAVIQSDSWKGYRLNPTLRIISPAEITVA